METQNIPREILKPNKKFLRHSKTTYCIVKNQGLKNEQKISLPLIKQKGHKIMESMSFISPSLDNHKLAQQIFVPDPNISIHNNTQAVPNFCDMQAQGYLSDSNFNQKSTLESSQIVNNSNINFDQILATEGNNNINIDTYYSTLVQEDKNFKILSQSALVHKQQPPSPRKQPNNSTQSKNAKKKLIPNISDNILETNRELKDNSYSNDEESSQGPISPQDLISNPQKSLDTEQNNFSMNNSQNNFTSRDPVGILHQKNNSFLSRQPSVKDSPFLGTGVSKTKPLTTVGLNDLAPFAPENINDSKIATTFRYRNVPPELEQEYKLYLQDQQKEYLKKQIASPNRDPKKYFLYQEPVQFFQKLVSHPMGRKNMYLEIPDQQRHINALNSNPNNITKKKLVRDSIYYRELNKYSSGFRSQTNVTQASKYALVNQNSYNPQQIPNTEQYNFGGQTYAQFYKFQLEEKYNREREKRLQKQKEEEQRYIYQSPRQEYFKEQERIKCQKRDEKRKKSQAAWDITQLQQILQTNKQYISRLNSHISEEPEEQQEQQEKKKKGGLFQKVIQNLKDKKKLIERQDSNSNTPSKKKLGWGEKQKKTAKELREEKIQTLQNQYSQLFEPDTSKKKRKSYYIELQKKKSEEKAKQWQSGKNQFSLSKDQREKQQKRHQEVLEKNKMSQNYFSITYNQDTDAKKRKSFFQQQAEIKKQEPTWVMSQKQVNTSKAQREKDLEIIKEREKQLQLDNFGTSVFQGQPEEAKKRKSHYIRLEQEKQERGDKQWIAATKQVQQSKDQREKDLQRIKEQNERLNLENIQIGVHFTPDNEPKKTKEYYQKIQEEQKALRKQNETDTKDARELMERKVEYVKPPTPEKKTKEYYQKLDEDRKKALKEQKEREAKRMKELEQQRQKEGLSIMFEPEDEKKRKSYYDKQQELKEQDPKWNSLIAKPDVLQDRQIRILKNEEIREDGAQVLQRANSKKMTLNIRPKGMTNIAQSKSSLENQSQQALKTEENEPQPEAQGSQDQADLINIQEQQQQQQDDQDQDEDQQNGYQEDQNNNDNDNDNDDNNQENGNEENSQKNENGEDQEQQQEQSQHENENNNEEDDENQEVGINQEQEQEQQEDNDENNNKSQQQSNIELENQEPQEQQQE